MTDHLDRIETVIEYVIEIHATPIDGSQLVRLAIGDESGRAIRLFDSLRGASPVYVGGDRHDGWVNLIAITARSPESVGTLIEQHRWDNDA